MCRHPVAYGLLVVLPVVGAVFLFPHDRRIMVWVSTDARVLFWWLYAGILSGYGAFERATLGLLLLLWGAGIWQRRRAWRRIALATLLACSLAGPLANVVKYGTGRPRPNAAVERDGFYGPTLNSRFASFPSAHTITAMATAGVLSVTLPVVAVPVVGFQSAVSLSRIYVSGHYVSDVLVGAGWGLFFGLLFGFSCRELNARDGSGRRDAVP